MVRLLAVAVFALSLPMAAYASAILQSIRGEVRAGSSKEVLFEARENQRLAAGTTITTGPGSQAVLKFDDGQQVVLNQNTEFRIVDFRFDERNAQNSRAIFDFVRGALRVVTGLIARNNTASFALRTPQATIGVRGTDFMAAIVNPLYTYVQQGSIVISNSPGAVVFGTGATASVANSAALAVGIPASSLPPAAAAAFGELGAVTISAVGGAATGAPATAAGTAGTSIMPAALVIGAAAAVAAAAAAADDNEATTTHH